jgi:hypothetical protein
MDNHRWHRRVVDAISKTAENHGFKSLDPCVVLLEVSKQRRLEYRPDAFLLRRNPGVHAVVFEVESEPTLKVIPGDITLASWVKSSRAVMYPYADTEIGSRFRGPRKYRDTYNAKTVAREFSGEDYRILRGSEIGTLDFVLVVKDIDHHREFERYLDFALRREWGRTRPFSSWKCIVCDATSSESARRSMGRIIAAL